MIKAVLFDYGGVLTEGGTTGCIQRFIGAVYDLPPETIDADRDLMLAARSGEIDEASFFEQMNKRHPEGERLNRQNFLAHSDIFAKSEPVYALAARLRTSGIQTGILSNIYDFTGDELRRQGFYDGFDPVILSCTEHVAKPEPEIYQRAIARLGVKPDEVIFVDDFERCLVPVRSMGWHAVLAVSPEQIVKDVERIIAEEAGQ